MPILAAAWLVLSAQAQQGPSDPEIAHIVVTAHQVDIGKDFDRAYVDKTLLPSARNADLKALIERVRPAVVQHLDHAKHLQAQPGK